MVRVCRSGGRAGISSWVAAPNPRATLWNDTELGSLLAKNMAFQNAFPGRHGFREVKM